MEAQTDLQTYLEQGKQALSMGQGREAAIAYAHSAQIEQTNPQAHLGLAEANLALGNYNVVQMACQRVKELQPNGVEASTAQALLDLLDRRYEQALQHTDAVISEDPSIAYTHALRAYLLRATHQDYDANLARARATRLSYGGRFDGAFPALETPKDAEAKASPQSVPAEQPATPASNGRGENQQEYAKGWSERSPMQRQVVRTRFALNQQPFLITNILVAINVFIYLILALDAKNLLDVTQSPILATFLQYNVIQTGQYWQIFTAMFLHFNIEHIGLNMLSLFFIGRATEMFYGKRRYLAIYLGAGIVGGIITALLQPQAAAAGASGAIFGVFGALGVFYIVNRRALGMYGRGAIGNWIFWLALNLVWGFSTPGIGIVDHIGGLAAGMVIAYLLLPHTKPGRTLF